MRIPQIEQFEKYRNSLYSLPIAILVYHIYTHKLIALSDYKTVRKTKLQSSQHSLKKLLGNFLQVVQNRCSKDYVLFVSPRILVFFSHFACLQTAIFYDNRFLMITLAALISKNHFLTIWQNQ